MTKQTRDALDNFQRHFSGDGVSDGPAPEYDYDFSGLAAAPQPDFTPAEFRAYLAEHCPGVQVCATRGTSYVYAGCPESMRDDVAAWEAGVYVGNAGRVAAQPAATLRGLAESVRELFSRGCRQDLVRADVGKAEQR